MTGFFPSSKHRCPIGLHSHLQYISATLVITNALGVGTQGLFAQESGAEAFFFKKTCSPRACLFLLLVRVTVGHSCCLWGMKFLNCSGNFFSTYFSTALVFTCFPGWTDSNWALLGALAGEIPRDYGSLVRQRLFTLAQG